MPNDLICPACGEPVGLGEAYCGNCGFNLAEGAGAKKPARVCPACGCDAIPGHHYCFNCGAKLEEEPQEAPARVAPAAPAPKARVGRCIICGFETDDPSMVYCPVCSNKLTGCSSAPSPTSGFIYVCDKCGKVDEACSSRYCTKCGAEYKLFCENCNSLNGFEAGRCASCGSVFYRKKIPPKASEVVAQIRCRSEHASDAGSSSVQKSKPKGDLNALSASMSTLHTQKIWMLILGILALIFGYGSLKSSDPSPLLYVFSPSIIALGIGNIICSIVVLAIGTGPSRYYTARLVDSIFGIQIASVIVWLLVRVENGSLHFTRAIEGYTFFFLFAIMSCLFFMVLDTVLIVTSIVAMAKGKHIV